jgi:hypothetical protein
VAAVGEPRDLNDTAAQAAEGDYGYDLAHEVTGAARAATKVEAEEEREPSRFEPPVNDDGGDYGYDEAHDMRPH